MNTETLYIFFITLFAMTGTVDFLHAQVNFKADDLKTIIGDEQKANARKYTFSTPETMSNYDVKWYRCWWNIDPAVRYISGNVTTLFAPVGQGLDSLVFNMNKALQVDSVFYHNNPVVWHHTSDLLIIRFPSTLPQSVPDSITVNYHGIPPNDEFTGFAFVQTTHNGSPIIWTESEPYFAGNWWPCKDGLSDKADSIDIFINTPSSYNSVSNGLLVSSTRTGANTLYHWKHRYPIATYLVSLAVTNYSRYTQQVVFNSDTLNVLNCVYPEDSATSVAQTAQVIPIMKLYDSLFGLYPFYKEKYGHAEYGGSNMENQTMTFLSSFEFVPIAHELAHHWFGDKVTLGSWTDIWLNEGFAVFVQDVCLEHFKPDDAKAFKKEAIGMITSQAGGSVYCSDTTDVNRIFDFRLTYYKGGMILNQLRWLLGDSAFFAGLRYYLSDTNLAYKFARTANLKSHLESSSGQDLTWYFNDWYMGQGYPTYHINWTQKGDTLDFTMTQTQSHPSVSFFRMLVPVEFKNPSHDTIISVLNTFSGQSFTASIPFAIDSVIIDPDIHIISGNNIIGAVAENSWQQNLKIFPNPAFDILTVIPEHATGNMNYKIYSSEGKLVYSGIFAGPQQEINVKSFASGLYSILFFQGNRSSARTFVKQ